MILHVSDSGLSLEGAGNLKAYSVRIEAAQAKHDALVAANPELRRIDAGHIAISQDALKALAGDLATDQEWLANFAGMMKYATSLGWVTEAGEIIGHIE